MKKKSLLIIVAILSLNLIFPVFSSAQEDQRTITVQDESGNSISGAIIYVGEGDKTVLTNENGEFFIPSDTVISVYIEAEGFESQLIDNAGSAGLKSIVLTKAPYQMGGKDKVYMPFGTFNKRQIPGAVTVLSPREILTYDQTDIEGAIIGRVPGLYSISNIRGMGDPLIVVDGIPSARCGFKSSAG